MATALARLRDGRNQSLREMAADVGVSHETIRRVENGRTSVRPSVRRKLEGALGLPFDVLTASLHENGDARKDAAVRATMTTAERSGGYHGE